MFSSLESQKLLNVSTRNPNKFYLEYEIIKIPTSLEGQ
jgi:hypothetical protein